jgi:3-dehydroquinate synthase
VSEAFLFRFGEYRTRVRFSDRGPEVELAAGDGLAVFDRNAHRHHGRAAGRAVVLPAGETAKAWRWAEKILASALEAGLGRDGRMVGIGGGVVCDLTAFAASLYMRGCRLALMPTTLLAMVDAALGGKTAVNLGTAKNLAGTFYPAEELVIWIPALATLPQRELRCGLAEAIKTALVGDPELLALLRARRADLLRGDPAALEETVYRSLAVKGRIVENDLRETGETGGRAVLNLGHTFAHALESATGFRRFRHGEAVAWGLGRALELGARLGVTERALAGRITALLQGYGFSLRRPPGLAPGALLAAMRADKKRRAGGLRVVLLRDIGQAEVRAVDEEPVLAALEAEVGGP